MTIRNTLVASHVESYFIPQDLATVSDGLLLPPKVWNLLLSLKGHQTARELAETTGLPPSVTLSVLRRLEAMGLVAKSRIPCPVTPAVAGMGDSDTALPATPFEGGLTTGAITQEISECTPSSSGSPIRLSLRTAARSAKKASVHFSLRHARPQPRTASTPTPEAPLIAPPLPLPTPIKPTENGLTLEAVMQTLMQKTKGDRMQAQLLAYRVFLRVPANLLEEAGIRSVFLIKDHHVLTAPALVEAITLAVRHVTGLSIVNTNTCMAA